MNMKTLAVTLCCLFSVACGFQPQQAPSSTKLQPLQMTMDRRSLLATAVIPMILLKPEMAQAGIDPTLLKSLPVQGDETGAAQRLRQVESIQRPASDLVQMPFEELPSGVSYREYREGKGEAVVQEGSKVAVEMTIRCKSFATANEPGGLKYFSTKDDTEFNELAWTVGRGESPPGLEEGMMGMHKNAVRRIEIPSTMTFAARNANQLPLPTTKDGKRRFDQLFKTDATLLFEVLVTRIK
ncbi:Peptidyl-prolyl cis-trans isomerase [Seminavis robusta]|uniref:peptidylprolyl isomerase n=1 Tax=Seminavis robusta TaxID=568900 RepID=A0A9N8EVA3_9STRA|nr:Peptidyl-prolyl cis-trans isomerase [Seminavis robusta]|eukprot:Sro2332_g323660.1 Peptidyl-prolyl cis-trans isomerase (240) ;mRNA; f:14148-14996